MASVFSLSNFYYLLAWAYNIVKIHLHFYWTPRHAKESRAPLPSSATPARTVVLTGATSGLGQALLPLLAKTKGLHIVIGCRKAEEGEAEARRVRSQYPSASVAVLPVDMDNPRSVLDFAADLLVRCGQESLVEGSSPFPELAWAKQQLSARIPTRRVKEPAVTWPPLHALINNAAIIEARHIVGGREGRLPSWLLPTRSVSLAARTGSCAACIRDNRLTCPVQDLVSNRPWVPTSSATSFSPWPWRPP